MAFVTIKYGNNQKALFNPNCKILVLLGDIKKRCCTDDAIVDLSDEKGEIKHLQKHIDDYASSYLKGREILILLEVTKDTENNDIKYTPLLKNMKKLYPEAVERLAQVTTNNGEPEQEPAPQTSPRAVSRSQKQRLPSTSNAKNTTTSNQANFKANKKNSNDALRIKKKTSK